MNKPQKVLTLVCVGLFLFTLIQMFVLANSCGQVFFVFQVEWPALVIIYVFLRWAFIEKDKEDQAGYPFSN